MSLLETFVQTPLAGAVGWTLLHSLWEGALISIALASVLLVIRSPRVRYALACVALFAMLFGFGLTLIWVMSKSAQELYKPWTVPLPAWKHITSMNPSDLASSGIAGFVPWLAPFWFAGICIFYLKQLTGWASVCRLRRRGVCCAPKEWQEQLNRLAVQLHLSKPVRLMESCLVDVPMVLGHFRPVILMPIGLLAGLPSGQVEAVLLHELAHICRYDFLVNVLQRFAEGFLFYHPAAWWISRVIRTERENCCDDMAVAICGDAHEYATALAALEQNRWTGREPAVAATGGNLMKRIRRLLYPKVPNRLWTPLPAIVILIASVSMALAAWPTEPFQQRSTAAQRDHSEASSYAKWLNQDVVYIITDEERAAFQKLAADEEREKFMEQFWLRRDPKPDTTENEFKQEHYRRIAYANERFRTTSDRQGWQTDRGHMYIVYGPPDEIEAHPSGEANTAPFEIWRYRHVEGIGNNLSIRFIDPTRTRDYRLAPGNTR